MDLGCKSQSILLWMGETKAEITEDNSVQSLAFPLSLF